MISGAFHLAVKDLRLLSRDRVALFWVLGFPVIFALFIGTVVRAGLSGDTGRLKLILVDEAEGAAASRVATRLAEHQRVAVRHAGIEEARRAVRRADAIGYLRLPRSSSSGQAPPQAEFGFDPARELETAYVEQLLSDALTRPDSTETSVSAERPPEIKRTSVAPATVAPKSASDIVFPSAVLWGLIGCAACFAVSLVAERTRGTYVRLRASPLTRHAILAGKALSALIASLAVASILTFLGTVVFDVRVDSFLKLFVALTSSALCFVGITVALGVLGRSEQAVAGAGWATLLVMAMLGGAMVPLSLMPEWLMQASHLSPVKWGILALEGATFRDFSSIELFVPCAILVAVGALSFLFGAVLFSRSRI